VSSTKNVANRRLVNRRLVGRRLLRPAWPVTPERTFKRRRYPLTKRPVLQLSGKFNPSTLKREMTLTDKKPMFWVFGMALLLIIPIADGTERFLALFGIACIYASINVMWTLILGTAGLQSFATLATVGVGSYGAGYLSVTYGIPWPLMLFVGLLLGGLMGFIISIPARRLDGLYYALLTLGLSEFMRNFVTQSDALGGKFNGALFGVAKMIPTLDSPRLTQTLTYVSTFVLLLAALAVFRLVNGGRIGLLLKTAATNKEDESFASAVGIDFQRARLWVFIIASGALGFIGAFYASTIGGTSLQIFSLELLLLMLAMIVIGGLGRAEGAVIGTVLVVFITQWFVDWGPWRIILVGVLALASVLYTRNGLFGLKMQVQEIRTRRQALHRAAATSRYAEFLPQEAPEIHDKSIIAGRVFERALRDRLRGWISPEVIAEHERKPLGQHSDHLERMLNYFRKAPIPDKYAVYCEEPFARYRVVALSGLPGVPPRVVDDKVYESLDAAYHAVFLRRVNDLRAS
jgi:branched-chain amino acid transport system permease protein